MGTPAKVLGLLSRAERRRGLFVLLMVVVMAMLETAGVASVVPFLTVVGDPAAIQEHWALKFLYTQLEFESVDRFLLVLAAGSFLTVIGSSLFRNSRFVSDEPFCAHATAQPR